MSFEKVGFIGLGLIGGSIAKTIKKKYPDTTLIATARHADTIQEAHPPVSLPMSAVSKAISTKL